jgi:hypothetical protein
MLKKEQYLAISHLSYFSAMQTVTISTTCTILGVSFPPQATTIAATPCGQSATFTCTQPAAARLACNLFGNVSDSSCYISAIFSRRVYARFQITENIF